MPCLDTTYLSLSLSLQHSAKAAGTSLNLALGEKQKVVRCCHETVREEDHQDRLDALVAIKILSRDKENVNELVDRALINMLLLHAGISPEEKRRVTVGPEDDIKTGRQSMAKVRQLAARQDFFLLLSPAPQRSRKPRDA